MKNFTRRKSSPAWLFIILLSLIACSKDGKMDMLDTEKQGPIAQNDCTIALSFDITTYTYAQAYRPGDQDGLTLGEQTLKLPEIESCSVEACILNDGQMIAEVLAKQPPGNTPVFPPGTIRATKYPEEFTMHKMTFQNGAITSYNAQGEVITQNLTDDGTIMLLYQNIIEGIREQTAVITAEQMSWVIEGFVAAGFEARPAGDERVVLLRHTFDDGAYSELIIDKELQIIRGQANFNAEGELQTKSYFSFAGEAGKPVLTGHTYVAYMDSPLSKKRMAIIKRSVISNFKLEKNR